jgi:hypothetical protein
MVMSDYYSRYPIVHELLNIKSSTVISHMKDIMSHWDICEKIVADGVHVFLVKNLRSFQNHGILYM